MPSMNVEVSHNLGRQRATELLTQFLDGVKQKYGNQVSNMNGQWAGNVLNFSFTTYGFEIAGKLTAEDSVARVGGTLPFAAMLFQGRIEQTIRDELSKVLAAGKA